MSKKYTDPDAADKDVEKARKEEEKRQKAKKAAAKGKKWSVWSIKKANILLVFYLFSTSLKLLDNLHQIA